MGEAHCNGAETTSCIYLFRLDQVPMGGDGTILIAQGGEDTQEGDFVGDTREEGIEAMESAELDPKGPEPVMGVGIVAETKALAARPGPQYCHHHQVYCRSKALQVEEESQYASKAASVGRCL